MKDSRSQKELNWEQGYINNVKKLHEIMQSRDKAYEAYQASFNIPEAEGNTDISSTNFGGGGSSSSITGGSAFELVKSIIAANEGTYTTVTMNDGGAVSIGKFQWNADRAYYLVHAMRAANSALFDQTLTGSGGASVKAKMQYKSWKVVTFTSAEKSAIQKVLELPAFQKVQDDLANKDLQGYIDKAESAGIKDPKAIAYFADLYNHRPVSAMNIAAVALRNGGTLEAMYKAALQDEKMGQQRFRSRRDNTYKKLLAASAASPSTNNASGTSTATLGNIPIAQIKNGKVIPPTGNRKENQKQLLEYALRLNVKDFVSLDKNKFSFPNGQETNLFLPHFADMMYLLYDAYASQLGMKKIVVTSGYRRDLLEVERRHGMKKVGPHMTANSIDLSANTKNRLDMANIAYGLGFRAIGVGKRHVHVDAFAEAHWAEVYDGESKIYYGPGNFK